MPISRVGGGGGVGVKDLGPATPPGWDGTPQRAATLLMAAPFSSLTVMYSN